MALRAESAQEEGRKGVLRTRRWLESTTHMELGFDAYDWIPECMLTCLDGSHQTFDLRGTIFKSKRSIFIENKSYTTVGSQASDYLDFLAIAYSATAAEIARTQDPEWEFMWVTTHPFSQNKWPKLTKRAQVKHALENDTSGVLGDKAINEDILDLLVDRIWLLVFNKRQQEFTLSPQELSAIEGILNRKGKS